MRRIMPRRKEAKKPPKSYLKKEILYLPFYLFKASYSSSHILFMVDALRGKISRLDEEVMEKGGDFQGNFPHRISPEQAKQIVLSEARFPAGIFSGIRLESLEYQGKILYPFLVYYLRKKSGYDIKVFDAVTGRGENFFARELIIEVLMRKNGRTA